MKLAITIGDAAGIGPEIALKALDAAAGHQVVLVGPANLAAETARRLRLEGGGYDCLDTGELDPSLLFCGRNEAATGRAAHRAVEVATRLVLSGGAAALVTAPISKAAWGLAGIDEPGHTEMIGRLAGGQAVMGFVGREADGFPLRLALATIHEPLRRVSSLVTRDSLLAALTILDRDLKARFAVPAPRIGVAGLNPHAGEGGRLGVEEVETIRPALEAARRAGIQADGPHPGDALFMPRLRRRFDCLLAMYHDQGLAPFKALTGVSGVNVTLGLPLIRTSPAHGTAFEIAGRNQADPENMRAAIRLALELAVPRR